MLTPHLSSLLEGFFIVPLHTLTLQKNAKDHKGVKDSNISFVFSCVVSH